MGSSTNIQKYPEGMLDLLESICDTEHPADIAYSTRAEANTARLRFYGLVSALVINQHSLSVKATRLRFTLRGPKKEENVLHIEFPNKTKDDAVYKAIAEKHAEIAARKKD